MSLGKAWTTTRTPLKMGVVGSVGTTVRRVRDSILSKERSREDLKLGIAGFYDRSSKLWEDVWGEVRSLQDKEADRAVDTPLTY